MAKKSTMEITDPNLTKKLIEYLPFNTVVDPTFWFEIKRLKLDELKLACEPIDICSMVDLGLSHLPGLVTFNYESFKPYDYHRSKRDEQSEQFNSTFFLMGQLIIYNTKEEFVAVDKRDLLQSQSKVIWSAITDRTRMETVDANLEPHLARCLMIVYADLKSYDFHFWPAYPTLNYPGLCFLAQQPDVSPGWSHYFTPQQIATMLESIMDLPVSDRLMFAVALKPIVMDTEVQKESMATFEYYFPEIIPFRRFWRNEYLEHLASCADNIKIMFIFRDFSRYPNNPGWLMRNYLCYLKVRLSQMVINREPARLALLEQILYRPYLMIGSVWLPRNLTSMPAADIKPAMLEQVAQNSFVHRVAMLPSNYKTIRPATITAYRDGFVADSEKLVAEIESGAFQPPAVGWERDRANSNRLQPRHVNCGNTLNPETLATDALHLNLKLMKWRLVPELDLDRVHGTRCLLLGSGTLGCYVARGLVAWGVNHITMVDNKNVSYSNPARQSLYTYEDAIGGDKPKASVAAKALAAINPGIAARGITLNVQMPDHPFQRPAAEELKEVEQLEQLIQEHDVIFLMMDTRESRWLPTVIATSMHRTVINVALGFDSFLVQRHGVRFRTDNAVDRESAWYPVFEKQQAAVAKLDDRSESRLLLGSELGCYFCHDVFAPSNSTKDRTLDQQCTVTRPGLAMIASGYAVEIFASLIQHPAGPLAPAYGGRTGQSGDDDPLLQPESLLGPVPHELRGFLSYEMMTPTMARLECCVACSDRVIDQYRNDRENFLCTAINDSKRLETMAGIDIFHRVDDCDVVAFGDESDLDQQNDDDDHEKPSS